MRKTLAGLSALAVCASFLMPAQGADDIAQPACFGWLHRNPPPPPPPPQYSRFYAVPAAPVAVAAAQPCCPQPAPACSTCTTQYLQQSYYQAVTTYQTQTQYEPVTSYQTSYYYEPVTTYRTSSYYCPNSCSYKQTVVPETGYQLKSKTCPVQSYVAKCVQVPVTTYQKAYYYQPQTVCTQAAPTCCPTAPSCCPQPVAQAPCCQPGGPPQVSASPGQQPPQVSATPGQAPPPGWTPPILDKNDSYRKESTPPPPKNGGTSWQPVSPETPVVKVLPPVPAQQTGIKLDRIVLGADSTVEGEVVRGDKTPRPGAKILFVNANSPNLRETTTANYAGRFQITLAAGGWLIYLYNADGDAIFHSRIEVSDEQSMGRIVLVNR